MTLPPAACSRMQHLASGARSSGDAPTSNVFEEPMPMTGRLLLLSAERALMHDVALRCAAEASRTGRVPQALR